MGRARRHCLSNSRKCGQRSCRTRLIQEGTSPSASTIARTQNENDSQSRYSCCAWEKRSEETRNNWRVARRRASSCNLRSVLPGCHWFGLVRVRPILCFTERLIIRTISPHNTGYCPAVQHRANRPPRVEIVLLDHAEEFLSMKVDPQFPISVMSANHHVVAG